MSERDFELDAILREWEASDRSERAAVRAVQAINRVWEALGAADVPCHLMKRVYALSAVYRETPYYRALEAEHSKEASQ